MIYTSEDKSIQYTAKDTFNLSCGLGYKVQRPPSTGRSILISIWPAAAHLSLSSFHPLNTFLQIKFNLVGRAGRLSCPYPNVGPTRTQGCPARRWIAGAVWGWGRPGPQWWDGARGQGHPEGHFTRPGVPQAGGPGRVVSSLVFLRL